MRKPTAPASQPEVVVVADAEMLGRVSAEIIFGHLTACVEQQDIFTIALSGGTTPRYLYTLLATDAVFKEKIPWGKVHFFWGDERHVPPDHPDSNYRMAHEAIFSRVRIPPENIHRVASELADAGSVAQAYEKELFDFFGLKRGELPRFDCILLGMGPDGHTASLFPATSALAEREHLIVANWVKAYQAYRITFTVPLINNAGFVVFLVSGDDKSETLKQVLKKDARGSRFPAQLIRPAHGKLLWIVDRAAAKDLNLCRLS